MKRSELPPRRVALARTVKLTRQPAVAASKRPKRSGRGKEIPQGVRDIVTARSRGVCEARIDGCLGTATNMHHRQRRAGGIHTAANLMHLCGSGTTGCHGWITAHPALSRAAGWIVSAYSDPSVEPVRYRCKFWAWLTEDGRIVGEGAAA